MSLPSRGGYMRVRARAWEPEHYAATWSESRPAPEWWAEIDVAWQEDRGELMSVRKLAAFLGWTRRGAEALLTTTGADRNRWDRVPEPAGGTKPGQKRDSTRAGTGTQTSQPGTDERREPLANRDTSGTLPGQNRDTSGTLARVDPFQPHPQPQPHRSEIPPTPLPPRPAGEEATPEKTPCPPLATLPAAPPPRTPTATPTSTATETPNPSPPAPTAAPSSGSCSAGSPPTDALADGRSADPVTPIRLPSPTRAAKIAQLRSALSRFEATLTTLRKFGGDTTSAEREAERVRLQIAALEASDAPDEPAAPPAPPPRPVPVVPPRPTPAPVAPPPPAAPAEPERPTVTAAPETAPVALQAVLLPAATRSSPPVVRNDSGAIGAHERHGAPVLAGPDTSPLTVLGIGGVPVTLPGDLVGLLDFDPAVAGWLVTGGVETSRHLLEYTEAEIQMVPRIGAHRARRIARHLRERWGIEPGCLARRTPDPKSRTGAAAIGLGRFLSRHGGES